MSDSSNAKGLIVHPDEGARTRALKEAVDHSVEKLLGGWKASVFAKCFPKNEKMLEAVRASLIEKVRNAIYKDLQTLIDENVADPLDQLGTLVKNYSGPKDVKAWRPSGDPVADVRAHDKKVLEHEKMRLLESLTCAQKKSEALLMNVKAGRDQCQKNSLKIQKHMNVLTDVAEACNNMPKDEMVLYYEGASANYEL